MIETDLEDCSIARVRYEIKEKKVSENHFKHSLFITAGLFISGCSHRVGQESQTVQSSQPSVAQQKPLNVVEADDDGQWIMATKDYANRRYSSLDQINPDNINQLKLTWSFSTGVVRGHETPPLVVGSMMYIVTPFPNYLYALDLSKAGAPMKWKYDPRPSASAQGVACCDVVNRGAAYANGRIFYNTLDNFTVAVDAESGKEIWKTKLG